MATRTVNERDSAAVPPVGESRLFKMSAKYLVDPEAKFADLSLDAACFAEAGTAIIQAVIEGLEDKRDVRALVYAALYQVELVEGMIGAMTQSHGRELHDASRSAQ